MNGRANTETDFWAKVEKAEQCWLWTGRMQFGGGIFKWQGRAVRAHCLAFALHYREGELTAKRKKIWHVCGNLNCVRPDHLTDRSPMDPVVRLDKHRAYHRAYYAQRMKDDPEFHLTIALRRRFSSALRRRSKRGSAVQLLGCTISDLRLHLESRFLPGMSWQNYGPRGWHIDHVRPLASFDLLNEQQLKQALHYTNLQPLWAADNQKKWARYEPAFVEAI